MTATHGVLRTMRIQSGLSIRDLERITKINRGRISIIERGVAPTEDEMTRILAAIAKGREAA